MPVVCALVPDFAVALARIADASLRDRPTIVVDKLERGRALAVDPLARALGARPGMTLVQAAACAREAAVIVADRPFAAALWERALDALDAASPLVEDAEEGCAYLEMRGIAGSPGRLLESVREVFAGDAELAALPVRAALAAGKFVARAGAIVRDGAIVRPGEERAFLAPLPLHHLDIDAGTLERLALLGIRECGGLADLPHGPFVRRFGTEAARWHARASGRDDEPLVPRPHRVTIERAHRGEGAAEREDQLLFALRALAARVAEDLTFAGRRCGVLRLELELEDADRHELAVTLAQPSARGAVMVDLLRARLEGTTLRSPVVGMRLRAERLETGGSMLSLFAGGDPDPEIVALALARLDAALGEGAARRADAVPGTRYESRAAYSPFVVAQLARRPGAPDAPRTGDDEAALGRATLAYRVLEPVPVAVRLVRGRPAFVDGHAVIEAAGPWRTAEAWWASALDDARDTVASDAFDVLLDDGTLRRIVHDEAGWHARGVYD